MNIEIRHIPGVVLDELAPLADTGRLFLLALAAADGDGFEELEVQGIADDLGLEKFKPGGDVDARQNGAASIRQL
ncbi:MAG: hypothetical protein ABR535_10545 [Pyrinomonadaceae bacterium]